VNQNIDRCVGELLSADDRDSIEASRAFGAMLGLMRYASKRQRRYMQNVLNNIRVPEGRHPEEVAAGVELAAARCLEARSQLGLKT
jgi:hypothetical protein